MPPRKKAASAKPVKDPAPPPESKAFDLDAAIQEVVEASGDQNEPFEFEYAGRTWKMRPAVDSDARILADVDMSEIQQIMAYISDLLGDQWAEFPRISFIGAITLIEKYSEHAQGVTPGE